MASSSSMEVTRNIAGPWTVSQLPTVSVAAAYMLVDGLAAPHLPHAHAAEVDDVVHIALGFTRIQRAARTGKSAICRMSI